MKTKPVEESSEKLLNDLHTLVGEAEEMLSDTMGEHSQEAINAISDRLADAKERVADLYNIARKKAAAGIEYADETIRENPYPSIAIAAGIGLLAGLLIGRRGR
jgi:ElaB/YqjD/DUF883 family membrane-anchored ribosome-binding protein